MATSPTLSTTAAPIPTGGVFFPKAKTANVTAVTITDRGFFIAVFVLIVSLKYHRVRARINVLSVGLTAREKELLGQFEDVRVFEADPANTRGPATRKGEAMLTAEGDDTDYIALLDGDCIATGDLTPFLEAGEEAIFARSRLADEEADIFSPHYRAGDARGEIPRHVLETWRADVGERATPAISNSVLGGNLIIHRRHLGFVRKWQRQMLKVLPEDLQATHDSTSDAYFQVDEFVLGSLLAFAADAPPLRRVKLDSHPEIYLAHLGPSPKPWVLWCPEKLRYFPQVAALIEWAAREGFALPPIPWTFRRRNAWLVFASAYKFGVLRKCKRLAGMLLKGLR